MSVVQTEVHDVVQDHDVADVIQVVDGSHENDGDYFNQEVTLSEEENEEDNLQYQQHNVEDDVGFDEGLHLLHLLGEDGEDHPDERQDDGTEEDCRQHRQRYGGKVQALEKSHQVDERHHGDEGAETDSQLQGEDAFHFTEIASSVPLDEKDVHDEEKEEDNWGKT